MPLRYRKFASTDVAAAHRLSLEVGWPHRLEDWRFLQRLGTGHVATDTAGVVGTILTWKHDARNASLGMVIVSPDRQGRGIGRELMKRALRDLTRRSVTLNATRVAVPLYEKAGFVAVGAIEQHQGIAAPVPAVGRHRDFSGFASGAVDHGALRRIRAHPGRRPSRRDAR